MIAIAVYEAPRLEDALKMPHATSQSIADAGAFLKSLASAAKKKYFPRSRRCWAISISSAMRNLTRRIGLRAEYVG
jgi:hypothetical protein